MTTYRAAAVRSDGWWAIEVPEVPGVFTQCRRLDQAADVARSAIVDLLEVEPATIEVEIDVADPEIRDAASLVRNRFAAAGEAAETARWERARAAHQLVDMKLSYRDIGVVLGVSHQRVAQILEEPFDPHSRFATTA